MSEEVKKCIREAVYIPFATAGTAKGNWGVPPYGCHLLQTRSDFIMFVDDETIAWPGERLQNTQSNLNENGKIQILPTVIKDGRIINGYRIEGEGRFETVGPVLEKFKKKYSWANVCVIMKIERIGQSHELTATLLKY